jgi:hypothetical protein
VALVCFTCTKGKRPSVADCATIVKALLTSACPRGRRRRSVRGGTGDAATTVAV